MRNITIVLICSLFCFVANSSHGEFIKDNQPSINASAFIDSDALCAVANNTQQYITDFPDDNFSVHAGEKLIPQVTLAKVQATLAFICQVHKEDKQKNATSRLHNNEFLKQNFEFYRWIPDKQQANILAKNSNNKVKKRLLQGIPEDQIFLTKYYTKLLNASAVKTEKYQQALYALPFDEQGLTEQQALDKQSVLTRFKYTRQQITSGVIAKNTLAKPLIWLTEEALHDVLLQGTGVVEVEGKRRYFNVHRNNGIAYDYTLGKREQARYWYFAEVPNIMGYGKTLASKIAILPDVSFAGNVKELGLGKLFLVNYQTGDEHINQLGILSDQGGAFDNNLFQLDLLKGSYYGWEDYYQANKHLPDYVNAWLLIVK